MTETTLHRADSADLWSAARALVAEYAASLELDLAFQNFRHELDSPAGIRTARRLLPAGRARRSVRRVRRRPAILRRRL